MLSLCEDEPKFLHFNWMKGEGWILAWVKQTRYTTCTDIFLCFDTR
jgi:hypothetical protein